MGGNLVYMLELKNPHKVFELMGTAVDMDAVGKAYRCKDFDFHNPDETSAIQKN